MTMKTIATIGDRASRAADLPKMLKQRSPARLGWIEPAVVWLTGLSGAGKSTIAREVFQRLRAVGITSSTSTATSSAPSFPRLALPE
jgi:putative protein kinase ArgK-like GTPase of G3E family